MAVGKWKGVEGELAALVSYAYALQIRQGLLGQKIYGENLRSIVTRFILEIVIVGSFCMKHLQ